MSPRSIRRAIERKAQKQARKSEQQMLGQQPEEGVQPIGPTTRTASASQILANRRNAQLSTGAKTPEGKAISSRNALKTGLTGKTVVLPNEDADLYQQHVEGFRVELKPVGDREHELVQSIADARWRLTRIPSLEFGIYALGRIQFAEEFAQHHPAEASVLIEAKTFLAYQRQLNNLSIQEARLRRQCEKDSAELVRLQQQRAKSETERAKAGTTAAAKAAAVKSHHLPGLNEIGFEFEPFAERTSEARHGVALDVFTLPQAA